MHFGQPWKLDIFEAAPHGPAALPVIAVASVMAAATSAYGAIEQGEAASNAAKYQAQVAANNATIANQNADYATQAGAAKEANQDLANAQREGAVRAALGSSGVDVNEGSALKVQIGQKLADQQTSATIRNQAQLNAYGFRTQASNFTAQSGLDIAQAGQATTGAALSATGSILSGASSVAGAYAKFGMNTPTGLSTNLIDVNSPYTSLRASMQGTGQ
jgi:hypothetical protein